jgi:hypothetical protein
MSLIGGQRWRTACASFSPSIEARHVNVGKYNPDIAPAFQYPDRFVGVCSLDNLVARGLDSFDRA